ncbi:MAG: hypothetical protein M3Z54_00235 [Gemmatimonadota bacterium]|nr:hypothetical protein [Gemmatimonadota bacterium]
MSLAEMKTAVDALSPEELAELAAFVRERDQAAWDRQIDADVAEGGRLQSVVNEVDPISVSAAFGICRDR